MEKDFSELVEYLDGKFSETNKRLDNLEENFRILQSSVDAYAKKADTYFQEMVALSHRVDRHEKWFHQVADKLGIKLEY
jgi:prefoldin subunit 5